MNDDEISETLNKIVPHRAVPEGLLAGARRRRRRTRALTGAAAVALVVALAVPLGLSMGSSDQQMVATPAPVPSSTAATGPLEPQVCRDADGNYPATTELPEGELPEGATRVWLCGGPSTSFAQDTDVGAPEPLTRDVAEAIAAFNAVPSTVGVPLCTPNDSIGFTVIYEYPDGEHYTVQGGLGGCESVLSSNSIREDARGYLENLRDLWNDQRSAVGTVFDADVPVCSARTSVMGFGIADMTRAYACGPVGDGDPATESVQIPLSDDLVADIVAEINLRDGRAGLQPGLSMEAPSLVFLSPEGDPFTIQGTPEGYRWYDPEPRGMNMWTPSPELAARIYDEMTRDGICMAPPRLVPAEVQVDVYDAGGGSDSVELVVERLTQAGFVVTNTGESAFQSLGSPIIVRGANDNQSGVDLVASQFTGAGGEVSREDDVVDVLVTSHFDEQDLPFAAEPATDVPIGTITCTAPSLTPEPSAMSTPSEVPPLSQSPNLGELGVEDACTLDEDGRMTPTDLPDNTLPDGPTAVWLCDESGAPREPLVGKIAVQEVVDSFKDLPTTATFDSYPTPGHAYVVVAYADGEHYTVEVETRSSDKVAWGSDRQHVRHGGAEWLLALKQFWVAQRNDTPQSPPIAPEVDVCDRLSWNLGRSIDRYDEDGALCAATMTDSGPQGVEVPANESLIEQVQSEAQKSKTPWPPDGEENPMQDWMGDFIILVDDYGDRLPLIPGSDGAWYWREGEDTWEWTPSRGLAAKLNQAFDTGRPSPQPTPS